MNCKRSFILLFTLWSVLGAPSPAYAKTYFSRRDHKSPINVEIKLPKGSFKLYEPIVGEIILQNTSPVNLPAVFEFKLFKDGKLKSQKLTEVKSIFPGRTRIRFPEFGIPIFNDNPWAAGHWYLTILQQNVDSF